MYFVLMASWKPRG